jgi:uncharacterized protein
VAARQARAVDPLCLTGRAGQYSTMADDFISPSHLNHIAVKLCGMGTVISFEDRAVAHLRARVAAAEEANQDLIAFARGHSGAVASIHEAVLAAVESEGFDHLIHIVTQEWPQILGLDAVAVALFVGDKGMRADASGMQFVDPRLIERSIEPFDGVLLRGCERGHPLFGPACELIRAEALIRIECGPPLPVGLLTLGQRSEQDLDARHGSELLMFLGRSLAAIIRRWLVDPES